MKNLKGDCSSSVLGISILFYLRHQCWNFPTLYLGLMYAYLKKNRMYAYPDLRITVRSQPDLECRRFIGHHDYLIFLCNGSRVFTVKYEPLLFPAWNMESYHSYTHCWMLETAHHTSDICTAATLQCSIWTYIWNAAPVRVVRHLYSGFEYILLVHPCPPIVSYRVC